MTGVEKEQFVFWPNGTVPFYVNPEHFDKEQSIAILSTLSNFTMKTCLQFRPVMSAPAPSQHVMVFENPRGVRKCVIDMEGHAKEEPHRIILGYGCLQSPHVELVVMKALGFPFEHNRAMRDLYIDVYFENIEPGFIPLYTKEKILPQELRDLPYDVDSVMHFSDRDYSKNGHRTFVFKNKKTKQNRIGLSKTDYRKIDTIYGAECQKRDRLAKIDMCKKYPSVRRKRDISTDFDILQNLRINRGISPPPDEIRKDEITYNVEQLNIDKEIEDLIDIVHKISAIVLKNERNNVCNKTNITQSETKKTESTNNLSNNTITKSNDIMEIITVVVNYAKELGKDAKSNLTIFCDNTNDVELFQRAKCSWGKGVRCPQIYKPTKSGRIMYSTKHSPPIRQSTKHDGKEKKVPYINWFRSGNYTQEANTTEEKRKRDIAAHTDTGDVNDTDIKEDLRRKKRYAGVLHSRDMIEGHKMRKREAGVVNNTDIKEDHLMTKPEDILISKAVTEKTVKSILNKANDEVKESVVKIDDGFKVINANGSIDAIDTTEVDKVAYGPSRRSHKFGKQNKRPKEKRREKGGERVSLPETVALTVENKEFYGERIWPDGVVRYIIAQDPTYNLKSMRARLEEVNKILKKKTCVRIQEISERQARRHTDYLVLDTSADYVTGRVGGRQVFGSIELFEGGQHRQHAAMMVMAMLGFYFELARHDRDTYVRVHNRHIRPDKLHHFEKIRSDATVDLPYDYASATHPAWQFWRRVGKTGISTVATYKDQDPDGSIMKSLGQNEMLLSPSDIIKINSIYGVQCFQDQRRMETQTTDIETIDAGDLT
ncbi:uncharacterized protein LOC112053833 [Bicyclus anynana]|uniref:Metalloendopeptidase n=1 Tax=Bicyclus anynana TaxID=110368 RepID=A0A6J1NZY1_BICAN|nr:uncharacterized protein LOC112053833 [Bicyclus anynana]